MHFFTRFTIISCCLFLSLNAYSQSNTQELSFCLPITDTIHLSPTTPPGGTWSADCNNCVDSSGVFNGAGLMAGNYQVLYQQSGVVTDTFLITIFAQPQITATGKDTVDEKEIVPLMVSGAETYVWIPGDALSCADCSNPAFTADTTTLFTIIGTDINGCTDTTTLQVNVRFKIQFKMPNAFTPNGDQANDIFRPVFKGDVFRDYYLAVYDRWGERVFDSYEPGEGWDGRLFGSVPLQSDVYVYVLKYELTTGEKGIEKNQVTLLR